MGLDNDAVLARFEVEHFDRQGTSASRRSASLRELRGLAATLNGRTLVEITPSDLMAWQGSELARGLAPSTVTLRETMLRSFVTWATAAGLIPVERSAQLKSIPPVAGGLVRNAPKPYRREEIEQFREALAARFPLAPTGNDGYEGPGTYALRNYLRRGAHKTWERHVRSHARRLQYEAQVSLALEEGLRRQEIYTVTLPQIAPDNAAVVVRTAKTGPGIERWREVPYTVHSRLCVEAWLDFRRLLAPGHDSPWLTLRLPPDLRTTPQTFRRFADSLEIIGRWQWHRFRHTFATERLRAGMPLEKLQKMMGHARPEQTLAYAEIVNADVQAEADRTEEQFARNLGLAVTP